MHSFFCRSNPKMKPFLGSLQGFEALLGSLLWVTLADLESGAQGQFDLEFVDQNGGDMRFCLKSRACRRLRLAPETAPNAKCSSGVR